MALSVLTLNAWGLLLVAKKRKERMLELGIYIQKQGQQHDVICLQEMWVSKDIDHVAKCGTVAGFRHHVHFKAGLFGSGLVTLSRLPFVEFGFNQYAAAGDAAALHCGDYLAKKGVGWVRVLTPEGLVDVYNTHLHANYSHKAKSTKISGCIKVPNDAYACYRLSQMLQLAQVVRHVSKQGSIGAVVCGDLNTKPEYLEYALLRLLLPEFVDAWAELHAGCLDPGHTCRAAGNTFESTRQVPERIDYVLTNLLPSSCNVTLQTCPRGFSYSDHFAVQAQLLLQPFKAALNLGLNSPPALGQAHLTPLASLSDCPGQGMVTSHFHASCGMSTPAHQFSGTQGLAVQATVGDSSSGQHAQAAALRPDARVAAGALTPEQARANLAVAEAVLHSCRRLLEAGMRRCQRQAIQRMLLALLLALAGFVLSLQGATPCAASQGTDVRLSGHFVYCTVPGFDAGPPIRCTNRAQVMGWLAALGASEPADPQSVRVPSISGQQLEMLLTSDPMFSRPQLDRTYDTWREEGGKIADGRHFKNFYLVDTQSGAEKHIIAAEDSHRRDRRYAYKAVQDGFVFENGQAVKEWLDFVVGKSTGSYVPRVTKKAKPRGGNKAKATTPPNLQPLPYLPPGVSAPMLAMADSFQPFPFPPFPMSLDTCPASTGAALQEPCSAANPESQHQHLQLHTDETSSVTDQCRSEDEDTDLDGDCPASTSAGPQHEESACNGPDILQAFQHNEQLLKWVTDVPGTETKLRFGAMAQKLLDVAQHSCTQEPVSPAVPTYAELRECQEGMPTAADERQGSAQEALGILKTIEHEPINLRLLESSQIAWAVSSLKDHACEDVAARAQAIADRWNVLATAALAKAHASLPLGEPPSNEGAADAEVKDASDGSL